VNGDGYCGSCFPHLNMIMALAARTAVKAAAKVARMSMHRTTPMAVGRRIAAMTHSSIVFKTFISPTPVFQPTIRPYVHSIRGIVGVILQPRHECTGLQRAYNGCNRCRRILFSTPPLHWLSSPASADLREAMTLERRDDVDRGVILRWQPLPCGNGISRADLSLFPLVRGDRDSRELPELRQSLPYRLPRRGPATCYLVVPSAFSPPFSTFSPGFSTVWSASMNTPHQ